MMDPNDNKKLLSVVVADDEPNVLSLIKRFVKHPDAEIVGEAHNGASALDLVMEEKPDLLITDICMPGLNGIDLIEKIKTVLPATEIVIISGYREFDYVRSALQYGVKEYLLKPIEEEDVAAVVRKAVERKKRFTKHKKQMEGIRENLATSLSTLRKERLLRLAESGHSLKSRGAEPPLFQFAPGFFRAGILKIDCCDGIFSGEAIKKILEETMEKVLGVIRPFCAESEYVLMGARACFVFNYREEESLARNWKMKREEDISINDILLNACYKYNHFDFTLGIGSRVDEADGLPLSFRAAKCSIANRLNPNHTKIIQYDSLEKGFIGNKAMDAKMLDKTAADLVFDSLDKEKIGAFFADTVARQIQNTNNFECVPWVFEEMIKSFRSNILKKNMVEEHEFPEWEGLFDELDNCSTVTEVQNLYEGYIEKALEACLALREQKNSKPIRIAKEYIEGHYMDDITLQDVADAVYMSPNHFSATFKSQTGMNFIDFLTKRRIEKAKEMLQDSLMNIAEIARKVGYKDVKYFSRLFAKTVGIKPMEYRKFYS